MTTKKPSSDPSPPRWFPYDVLGKILISKIKSALALLEVPADFQRILSPEILTDRRSYLADILVELSLTQHALYWGALVHEIEQAILHVEVTDRYRPELVLRMVRYHTAILHEFGIDVQPLRRILVMGMPPAEGAVHFVPAGRDDRGRMQWVTVLYFGALRFELLSEADQQLPVAQIYATLQHGTITADALRRVMDILKHITDAAELAMCTQVVWAFADIRQQKPMVAKALQEEGLMAGYGDLRPDEKQAIWGFARHFIEDPYFQDMVDAEVREPAMEKGQLNKHVEALLEILQAKSMRLAKEHESQLRKLPYKQLPPFRAAMEATSGSDFARRAGLAKRSANGADRS